MRTLGVEPLLLSVLCADHMWKSNKRDKGRDCILYDRENRYVVKVFIASIRSRLTPGENVRMILL